MLYGQYDNIEIWKRHPVYYKHSCSTWGRVRRDACIDAGGRKLRTVYLKPRQSNTGSWRVSILGYEKPQTHVVGRLVLETFCGPAPAGEECCHGVNGRNCHSLDNLSWGTKQKNAADRHRDGTAALGSKSGMAKLTEEQVVAIRQDTRTQEVIAAEYGVTHANIGYIKRRKTWRHVSFTLDDSSERTTAC